MFFTIKLLTDVEIDSMTDISMGGADYSQSLSE